MRVGWNVRLMAALVAVLLSGAALGCAQERPASETLPTVSAVSSSAGWPPLGPTDFPVPATARTQDGAGALAFLTYWLDLIDRQQSVPAGQPLRDLGPECEECLRIAHAYDEAAAAGNHYEGGAITLLSAAEPTPVGDELVLSFLVGMEAEALVDAHGLVVVENGPPPGPYLSSGLQLRWSADHRGWLVTAFTLG